ncbi:MAG: molybdate ABC transporter substrate-binding protein [Chloroflexaceae bacterium]|nr:molybdate ABC transporter substrate-binding protein [Chloroflexaceae bacterium]
MQGWLRVVIVAVFMVVLSGCTSQSAQGPAGASPPSTAGEQPASGELTVFAAASLTEAFTQIGADFEAANPGTKVVFNFAGSQQLAQQLAQGAPADVFASANEQQMDVAVEDGRVTADAPQDFGQNQLVVVVPADNPGDVETLADLAKPGLKVVLASADVPVGGYSLEYLDKANAHTDFSSTYRDAVLENVVSYEQTVKAVLTKVVLGEADAGIVYTSDITANVVNQVQQIAIPDDLNTIAVYPIAQVSDSTQPALAEAFIGYVLSAEGQRTLADFGFLPIE